MVLVAYESSHDSFDNCEIKEKYEREQTIYSLGNWEIRFSQ